MRTIYYQPLVGVEPFMGQVTYEDDTNIIVDDGFLTKEVLNKRGDRVIADSVAEYYDKMASQDIKKMQELEKEMNWRARRAKLFYRLKEENLK